MPTDIVELCIAACCIAGMVLVRSPILAARDGLDGATRAVATGMASTLMLVVANGMAFLLSTALSSHVSLAPSTMATVAPLIVMIMAPIVAMLGIAAVKKVHAALHRLLASLAIAIAPVTLLLASVTALLAPAQSVLHAALTAIGAGFGFTLLLRLCVILSTLIDNASTSDTTLPASTPHHGRQTAFIRIAGNSPVLTLLLASLLAALITAIGAAW